MLISELPKAYHKLANLRRDKDKEAQKTDSLFFAFSWVDTPEGGNFWLDCYYAKSISELPQLPQKMQDQEYERLDREDDREDSRAKVKTEDDREEETRAFLNRERHR